ncbi:MAG: hypothetical protein AAF289_09320 [Cyanobacteria bacterium P01_A01_bin.135]
MSNRSTLPDLSLQQKRMRAERMHDVSLLLEEVFRAEESTIKLILDRLYDVGSLHVIDQKLSNRFLNRTTKAIAPRIKPVFKVVGFIWFRKKCPDLVTNWLYKKVTAGQLLPQLMQELEELEEAEIALLSEGKVPLSLAALPSRSVRQPAPPAMLAQSDQEIRRLRSQVQFLMGALVCTVMLLGSATLWLMRDSMPLLPSADSAATACLGDNCLETSNKGKPY